MAKISEHDVEQLDEMYNTTGLGDAISSGYLGAIDFESEELAELARRIDEDAEKLHAIYRANI